VREHGTVVCVCLVTAVTKNRNVECENMALLCVLGYCSDEKQKCGVQEYGTGVCVCLVTAVTKNRNVECENMALVCVCAWLLQ